MPQKINRAAALLLSALLLLSLLHCSKSGSQQESAPQEKVTKTPNYLEGPCPYDCHDTRCKAYYQGYCGPTDPPPPPPTVTVRANSNNPYNYIGSNHNSGCTALIGQIDPNSATLSSDILSGTRSFLSAQGYTAAYFDAANNYLQSHSYAVPADGYASDPTFLFNKLYNDGLISSTTLSYLNQMNSVIDNIIGDNDPSQALYNTAASQLITIENAIAANATLSDIEKQSLLMTGSVYRYSGQFWANYILNQNGGISLARAAVSAPGSAAKAVQPPARLSWRKFWRADAAGAIEGGIGGGIAAGITGGPAAIPLGILAGALGGGIGASIASLIFRTAV